MKKYFIQLFIDFGFQPNNNSKISLSDEKAIFRDSNPSINNNNENNNKLKFVWTLIIYFSITFGILSSNIVVFPYPERGIDLSFIQISTLVASLIIALAALAPILKILNMYHKGQLSWQHCITAFFLGFFSKTTLSPIIDKFTIWIS